MAETSIQIKAKVFEMIAKKDEKILRKLLSLAAEPDQALSYDELRGFLFGLAITPDVVAPSEWLPAAFGDKMFVAASEEDGRRYFDTLMQVYNKLTALFQEGRLGCPPELVDLHEDGDFAVAKEWTYGLTEAMLLREEIWYEEEEMELEELTPEEEGLQTALAVIQTIALPDKAAEIFGNLVESEGDDLEPLLASFFSALPGAVDYLVGYALLLEAERQRILAGAGSGTPGAPQPVQSEKVGRNEPCPCGSGKKYKKCCLQQSKVVPIH